MSPVFRVKEDSSTAIAAVDEGKSIPQLIRELKARQREDVRALKRKQAEDLKEAKRFDQEAILSLREQVKKQRSTKAVNELESKRKERVKSARRRAEYDIYKKLMMDFATINAPIKAAHKTAVEYAEHIVKHSPPGHPDVAFVE